MKKLLLDFWDNLSKVNRYYGYVAPIDEKDAICLKYTEDQRVISNLRRTVLFTFFLIFYLLVVLIVTPARNATPFLAVGIIFAAVGLCGFMAAALYLYRKAIECERLDSKTALKLKVTYTVYWFVYFIMTIVSSLFFIDWYQGITIWLPIMMIGFIVPVFNMKEGFIIDMTAIASLVLFLYKGSSHFDFKNIIIAIPIFLICILVADINHLERLNYFYEKGMIQYETNASIRRLGNVFEEVFDLAFEFDLRSNNVIVLRCNDDYAVKYDKPEISFDEFTGFVNEIVHPEDALMATKMLNPENLVSQFMSETRNQIYFEGRILNAHGEYSWVSVLLTKEGKGNANIPEGDYLLCLIQNIDERKKNEDRLKLEAEKDPLTQLYNKMTTRSLIEETLEKNASASHALLIIDIDNFKTINDTRGHTVGDQILLAFANELNRNFRESDILGRAGGDEFIVLIKNVQSVAMICDKLQQLTSSFKKYGIDHGFPGRLSTSIGVAMFNKDGVTYEELFKKADAALYEAKRNGKDQYKFSISKN